MGTSGCFGWTGLVASALFLTACSSGTADVTLNVSVMGGEFGSVSSDSPQLSCDGACSLPVKANTTVALRPMPTSAGTFQGWGGDCSGTGACELAVTRDMSVTATFAPRTYSLHVEVQGTGQGVVRMSDGSECTGTCDLPLTAGQHLHLDAVPNPGSYLGGWGNKCAGSGAGGCDFEAGEGLSVIVQFGKLVHLEITGIGPDIQGQVISSPGGIDCGATCAGWFKPGQKVTLNASTTDGLWTFKGWSGADCSTSTCEVTLDTDKTIGAQFSNRYLWARSSKYTSGFATSLSQDGNFTVAVVSTHAQDFGGGSVVPNPLTGRNLFVARIDSDGVPLFTRFFGGSADMNNPLVIREDPDGGFSLIVGIAAPNTGAPTYSIDLGSYQVTLGPNEFALAWMNFNSAGEVTGAGPLDQSFKSTTVVQSGSTTFSVNTELNSGGDTISRLGSDWSRIWSLTNPNQRMGLYTGAPDTVWVTAQAVPAEMGCAGGPAPYGALLRVDANGACSVAWAYPEGLYADAVAAPGGAILMDVSYAHAFEFAGSTLPDPPTGFGLQARLRFDVDGNPKWSRPLLAGGGTSGVRLRDALTLANGELLLSGSFAGISDFSPTDPDPGAEFLATCSDNAGELSWYYPFRPLPGRTSSADFVRLGHLPNDRIALWGSMAGTFGFGGDPIWVPGNDPFLAVYQF